MSTDGVRVVVVYPRASDRLADVARCARDAFVKAGFAATSQAAEETALPYLSAADIMVLAAEDGGEQFAVGPYQEIQRACSGVNYAGRLAAFFSAQASANVALSSMLAPTGIDRSTPFLDADAHRESLDAAVTRWVAEIRRRYKEMMDERGV